MQNAEKQNYYSTSYKKKSKKSSQKLLYVLLWRIVQRKSEFGLKMVSI